MCAAPNTAPMNAANTVSAAQQAEKRQALREVSRWWWAWLVTGVFWILVAIIIAQARHSSAVTVGTIVGVTFVLAGAQELAVASVASGWRWLWIVFGVVCIVGGIYALVNPTRTFLAVASLLGVLLVFTGLFWVVEAFSTRPHNGDELWWLGLVAGFLMIGLGFWLDSQSLITQASILLIFAGVWALAHGLTDINKAFTIKRLGTLVAG